MEYKLKIHIGCNRSIDVACRAKYKKMTRKIQKNLL